ncbi:hypothetical protein C489_01336 [Natrinema versiforme JCM 10478]|uniref:TRASH domain-containing protein n=1 Tax=Natrinema versiforme JCM 10478 TaxID=1227496 RepID=L9YA57_9EURY|nr:hypothetical protein [Natrinema versiforme]ELY70959.1 hypothetical protein C489_01336 [Natrinema versiforme JCM 10478]
MDSFKWVSAHLPTMTDSTDDSPDCRQCGNPVEPSSEQRVVTTVEDGATVYRHFCTDDCLEEWESSTSA